MDVDWEKGGAILSQPRLAEAVEVVAGSLVFYATKTNDLTDNNPRVYHLASACSVFYSPQSRPIPLKRGQVDDMARVVAHRAIVGRPWKRRTDVLLANMTWQVP